MCKFLQFKEFKLYWRADFLRLEEEYWRCPFLITFIGVNFEAGSENFWNGLGAEQNSRVELKESAYLFIPLFWGEREIEA